MLAMRTLPLLGLLVLACQRSEPPDPALASATAFVTAFYDW